MANCSFRNRILMGSYGEGMQGGWPTESFTLWRGAHCGHGPCLVTRPVASIASHMTAVTRCRFARLAAGAVLLRVARPEVF